MKYNFKKKLTAMLSATLAAVTFLSVPASALTWEGSSGGGAGGGDTATKNNYTIADTSATACGYRFSRIDYYGNRVNAPIDVACSTYSKLANAQTAYRFETKYNKLELKNYMYSSITWNTTSQWIDTDANVIGVILPTAVSNIQATVMNDTNFDKICKALGMSNGATDLDKGDKILVEPLFALNLQGVRHVLTVTEIGIWGGYEFGWDKGNKSTNDGGGSYGYISNFCNNCWPSSLYTEKVESGGTVFWNAGWDAWGNGKNVYQRLLTFRQMVENGFGVGLAYDNKEEPIETVDVDLYPTGVTWLDSNGNETYYLIEGRTYTPVFHFYNAGSVGVYARVSSWSIPYWKDVLYDDWGNASTQIYIGADSGYSIQSREPITITQGLYYGDGVAYEGYELNVDTIKHKLTIALDCTDSYDADGNYVYVQESNTGNNQQTYTNWFSPKEPSLSQWVVDQENSASNWIHDDSIYGQWKLYSGEQVNSYLWIQNNSSFNINIIDKFKAILGLDNNLLQESNDLRYFSANGKEGDNWTRNSGVYRVKNTNKNTHKTLYLTDTAAEKSYAEGAGVNIADLTTIANNVTLNRQQFFSSGSYDGGNGNTCTRDWDNNSRILTLNGVDSIGFWNNTFDYTFKPWTRYRVTVEYVSGSVSLNNGAYFACLAFQGANEEGGRVYADIKFPNCSKQGTSNVCTGFVDTDGRTQYTFRPWIYIQAGGQLTFNNYKVKVKIEEVSVTDWDMSYTRHIQGYSVVPTDLEASALNLYDADTGERIKEGTVLKAGQKVYSETTYTNYTETPVAATFQTKHNNNNNTEYYIADNASMASSVKSETPIKDMANLFENKTVRNSKGQTITQSWDGESRTLTLNGSGTANFEPIASVAAEFKEGNTYRVTLEYVSGTLIGAKNTEVPSSGLFFTAAGNSGSDRRIFVDVDYPKFNAKNSNTCTGEFTMLRDSGSLYVGIFFNDKSTLIAYNNYKIRVNIEKVSPKVSWNSDSKTLSVSGTYDRNRVFSEDEGLGWGGQSSDGRLTYSVQKTFEEDGFYLTLNGYTYGGNNGYNLFSDVTLTDRFKLKDGDRYVAKAEYISGSLKEDTNNTLTILALRQYREDGSVAKDSNGNNCWFDLLLPHSSRDKYAYSKPNSDTTVSWEMTVASKSGDNLANNTLRFGLWAYDYDTGDDGVTFNNYKVKITFEKINHYPSVNETVISDTMSLDMYNNYNIRFKNIGGNVTEGNSYLSVQYLDGSGNVIDSHDMPVNSTDITSYGISQISSSVKSFRLVLKSDAGTGSKVTYNDLKLYLDLTKNSMTQCNVASDSNSVHDETCVIAAKQSVTVRSNVFEISAIPHNKITLSAYIYLKNLVDNTEYEYNENNNTLQKEFVIETPFKPTVVQANSLYRRGINVITSYKIKNDSKRDYGTESDISIYGDLTAKLELYRNSSMTGTPFATVYCDYCVPMDGKETLVWFEWKVPTDSPSKLYAKMTCDAYNGYSSSEFIDNGTNSKNTYCVFNIVQPKVTSTPDTTFAKKEPYWYESGYKSAKALSEDEGLNYYGVTKAKSETEGEKVKDTVRDKETEEYNAELNKKKFFESYTKNSLSQTWDNDSRILTLNGSLDTSNYNGESPFIIPSEFKAGDTFECKMTYISGSMSETGSGLTNYTSMTMDFSHSGILYDTPAMTRRYIDVLMPNYENNGKISRGTLTFKDTDASLGFTGFRLLVYHGENTVNFNNYKIKVEINKLSSEEANEFFKTQKLFENESLGNSATQSWDNNSRILTINGTVTNRLYTEYSGGTMSRGFYASVNPGDMFRVKLTYVSGTLDGTNASLPRMSFETANGDRMGSSRAGFERAFKDMALPRCSNPDFNDASRTLIYDTSFYSSDVIKQASGMILRLYIDGTAVFDNYKIKVEVEKITDEAEKSLNRAVLYEDRSWHSATQKFTASSRNLYINGTAESAYQGKTVPVEIKKGDKYRITLQHSGGTIASLNRNMGVNASIWFGFYDGSGNYSQAVSSDFPNVTIYDGNKNSGILTVDLTAENDISSMVSNIWISTEADGQADKLSFNGYSFDVFFEKISDKENDYSLSEDDSYDTVSWSYYVAKGDTLVLKRETATLKGSTIELIPDGSPSAKVGYDNLWNIKSGYGYKLNTEFKSNPDSTAVQSGYAVFPELLYKVEDNVNGYTNISGVRTGFATVKNKSPSCGGTYATYSTLEKTKQGTLILPNNESSKTATHFIPVWYPITDYRITCYVADAWTPGGMLAKKINSSTLHIVGNMYDDYVVSEK